VDDSTYLLVVCCTAAQEVRFMLQRLRGAAVISGKPLESPFADIRGFSAYYEGTL
jgi:hypothetical protein